jgi:hypothetical protein
MVMDLDGAIHSDLDMGDLDTGIWLGGLGYGGFGWNNPYYGYNNFMVVKDITETTLQCRSKRFN